jgi:hypothetical protein
VSLSYKEIAYNSLSLFCLVRLLDRSFIFIYFYSSYQYREFHCDIFMYILVMNNAAIMMGVQVSLL